MKGNNILHTLSLAFFVTRASGICPSEAPSFDREAGTPYSCSSSTTDDVHLYWTVDGAAVHMALTAKDVSGWLSIGFAETRGRMDPADSLSGYGMNVSTQKLLAGYDVSEDNTVLTDITNREISTLTIGGESYRVLRFTRTLVSIPSGVLSLNYAYHNTSNTFPSLHTSRGGWKSDLMIANAPVNPLCPSEAPSFDREAGTPYSCSSSTTDDVHLYWTVDGAAVHMALTAKDVSGWLSIGFAETRGRMDPADSLSGYGMNVSTQKLLAGYDVSEDNTVLTDITNREISTLTIGGESYRVLRFTRTLVSIPSGVLSLNYAYHNTSNTFPSLHTSRGGWKSDLMIANAPVNPLCPSEAPSFDREAGTPYSCSSSTTDDVHLYWTVDGAAVHMALTAKDVSGWLSIGFAETRGRMDPADSLSGYGMNVSTQKLLPGYDVSEDNTVLTDITNREISTLTIGGESYRVLRFTRTLVSIPSGVLSLNYAYHNTSNTFPSLHTSRGGWKSDLMIANAPVNPLCPSEAPSFDREAGTPYSCSSSTTDDVHLYWTVDGAAVHMALTAKDVSGWLSIGFAETRGRMDPADSLSGYGMNVSTQKLLAGYDVSEDNTVLTDITNREISTLTIGGESYRVLRFTRTLVSIPSGVLSLNYAYHNTSNTFPSLHTSRGGWKSELQINGTAPVIMPTTPTPMTTCPSEAPSFDREAGTPYSCSSSTTDDVHLYWTVDGAAVHMALTAKDVSGWLSIGFAETRGRMDPADSLSGYGMNVSTQKLLPGYDVSEDNTVLTDITNREISTLTIGGESYRVLRFTRTVASIPSGVLSVNYAFHSTSNTFPSIHTSRGGWKSDLQLDSTLPTSLPTPTTEAPTGPPAGCTPSTLPEFRCMETIDTKTVLHWTTLSNGTVDAQLVVAQNSAGWCSVGLPINGFDMIGAKALVSDGLIYDMNGKTSASIVQTGDRGGFRQVAATTRSFRKAAVAQVSGDQVLRFSTDVGTAAGAQLSLIVGYHGSSSAFPATIHSARYGLRVSATGGGLEAIADNTEKVKAHSGVMVAVWAYVVPFAILLKRFGTDLLGTVWGYPVAFILHGVLMLGSAITTSIFSAVAFKEFRGDAQHYHKELGNALLVVMWVQVVLGLAAPAKDSQLRIPFVVSHTVLGIASFGMAIGQMESGLRNVEELYTESMKNDLLTAMIVGLCCSAALCLVFFVMKKMCTRRMAVLPGDENKGSPQVPDDEDEEVITAVV